MAPDGTHLGVGPGLASQFNTATFDELSARVFGNWTVRETPFSPFPIVSEYAFTFSPFNLTDVFHETPVITTPTNGATVPSSFLVQWGYPSGTVRLDGGVELNSGFGAVSITNFFLDPNRKALLEVDRDLLGSTPLTFRTGARHSLTEFVSPITPLSGPAPTTYSLMSEFRSMSLSTTVYVVPEPTSCMLALAAIGLAFRLRSRPVM